MKENKALLFSGTLTFEFVLHYARMICTPFSGCPEKGVHIMHEKGCFYLYL